MRRGEARKQTRQRQREQCKGMRQQRQCSRSTEEDGGHRGEERRAEREKIDKEGGEKRIQNEQLSNTREAAETLRTMKSGLNATARNMKLQTTAQQSTERKKSERKAQMEKEKRKAHLPSARRHGARDGTEETQHIAQSGWHFILSFIHSLNPSNFSAVTRAEGLLFHCSQQSFHFLSVAFILSSLSSLSCGSCSAVPSVSLECVRLAAALFVFAADLRSADLHCTLSAALLDRRALCCQTVLNLRCHC